MYKYMIAALLLSGLVIYACKRTSESAPDTNARPVTNAYFVRTADIAVNGLTDPIHLTGIIESDAEARPSFKTGGVIAQTYVKEGDVVRKGQLLAKLNLTEIEAQATQAQFALDKAMRDHQRIENLYRDSIATLEQLQNAATGVDMAKKSLQIAKYNVSTSEARSPIAGKVVKQLMHEGEVTAPGNPIYYIIGTQSSDWKITAGLTDKDYARVKKGTSVRISLDAYPELSIDGKVHRLSDVANPSSGTFDIDILFPSKDKRIAAGMIATLEITPASSGEYPVIPIEALVSSNGKSGVVYIPRDTIAEKRTIRIRQFHGETVAVQSGLEGVTSVITAGSSFLEDGDRIIIEK